MNKEAPMLVCLGHHKCASTTLQRIFVSMMDLAGRQWAYVGNIYPDDLSAYARELQADALSLGNADPERLEELGDFRAFHLIRDPRDIVVSAYFSHRNSHSTDGWPDMADHRKVLKSLPLEDGLILELDFWPTRVTLERMGTWNYQDPRILEACFEDFVKDLPGWIERWARFYGLRNQQRKRDIWLAQWNALFASRRVWNRLCLPIQSIPPSTIERIAEANKFENLSGGRERGEEAAESHYRSGQAGSWREFFTPRLRAAFLEHFPGLLEKTGYKPF